jgi:hypothetical protein
MRVKTTSVHKKMVKELKETLSAWLANCAISHGDKEKVKFSLEQAMQAQRESRGIALLFL